MPNHLADPNENESPRGPVAPSAREKLAEAQRTLLRTVGLDDLATLDYASQSTPATGEQASAAPPVDAARTTPAPASPTANRNLRRVQTALERRAPPKERSDKRNREWQKRFAERYQREHPGQTPPPCIPRNVWITCACLIADGSGKFARAVLRGIRNRVFAGALRDAALAPLPGDNGTRYDWTDSRARYVLAIGYAIYSLSYGTNRRGWSQLCRGLSRHALLTLVRSPFRATREPYCESCKSRHPSLSALSGRHRVDGSLDTGQIGWLRALDEAGAISIQQFKDPGTIEAMCQPWEIGERGYPINWYWIRSPLPVGRSIEELLLVRALHERGWDAPREQLQRRESYVRALQPSGEAPAQTAEPP